MGLAASQARFLCLTARKADCEYKSTELAQQKLEITNQMSDISADYAKAMQSTKLMWANEAVGADYGLSYHLLMTPTAVNDYNPYMVTTPSGAIVLNNEYAAAARAAGISKAGGVGSQASRDKFISALVPAGIVTNETADAIVKNSDKDVTFVQWNPIAGLGGEPLNKGFASYMTLSDMALSDTIGLKTIDWGKLFVANGQLTEKEKQDEVSRLSKLQNSASLGKITPDIVNQLKRDLNNEKNKNPKDEAEVQRLQDLVLNAQLVMNESVNQTESANIVSEISAQLGKDKASLLSSSSVDFTEYFNIDGNSLESGEKKYSVVRNGVINYYKDEVAGLNMGDILTNDIVIMSRKDSVDQTVFVEQMKKLFKSITAIFGYSPDKDMTGQGLNVDETSALALESAYYMTVNKFFKIVNGQVKDLHGNGSRDNMTSMVDNSAYLNAEKYNSIGTGSGGCSGVYALSLSNLVSSFLTYYENFMTGADSDYVVGASTDTSQYVTDNKGYKYVAQSDQDALNSMDRKNADFFDQLYNNILQHGWREDAAVEDNEYLESAIKDGRYLTMSLNQDGHYYQTRYNETGYMVEVLDSDAIARAEAEFTSKKAELTYKEDSIDIKTKQLDAEISAISTEYETVKNLISKSIEKTFQMFSN